MTDTQSAVRGNIAHITTALLRAGLVGTLSLLPASAPRFIYTVLLTWHPLRAMTNGMLRRMIPADITIPEGTIVLNPDDPVVSGALMLGVHEPTFRRLFTSAIRPGMTILDIGANIGYYTLISSVHTGPSGMVIAFEPEPTNMDILRQMLKQNALLNVTPSAFAIGHESTETTLYLDPDNKGKHSLLPTPGNATVIVRTVPLQLALEGTSVHRIDLIKMDIEGWEGKAFRGMQEIIERDHPELFFEFAPVRIAKTGEDPVQLLSTLVDQGYELFEINEKQDVELPVTHIEHFTERFVGFDDYADVHARKRSA